jgi:hypothetical protein
MPKFQATLSGRIELEIPHVVTRVPETSGQQTLSLVLEGGKVAIIPTSGTAYAPQDYVEDDLKNLRTMAMFAGVVNFHGHITRIAEDGAERYSFAKDNHRLVIERAILAWPDGTPVEA